MLLIISLILIWISSIEYESKFILLACNSWGFELFFIREGGSTTPEEEKNQVHP